MAAVSISIGGVDLTIDDEDSPFGPILAQATLTVLDLIDKVRELLPPDVEEE